MEKINEIFALLIIFQIKHFLADYVFQTSYMLNKFKPSIKEWFLPLVAHCFVHAVFCLTIILFFAPEFWWICGVDFLLHFLMDRIKASPHLLGRFKMLSYGEYQSAINTLNGEVYVYNEWRWDDDELDAMSKTVKKHAKKALRNNSLFWVFIGFDQLFHHLSHYLIIFWIMFWK